MYPPHGYGSPQNFQGFHRPQHSMMQDPDRDHYQHPEQGSFHPSAFHNPHAPRPLDDHPPPYAVPPSQYPPSYYSPSPNDQPFYPPPPAPYPPPYDLPYPPSFDDHRPPTSEHGYGFSAAENSYGRPPFGEHSHYNPEQAYAHSTSGEYRHPSSDYSFVVDQARRPSAPHHTSSSSEQAYSHSTSGEYRHPSSDYSFVVDQNRPSAPHHTSFSSEQAYAHSTSGEYGYPSSDCSFAPVFDQTHGPSAPYHTASSQEKTPWITDQASAEPVDVFSSSTTMAYPLTDVELPKGQLVRVFCKSNRIYNLAVKDGRLMMREADSSDESQQWIRDDKYSIRVRDSYGHPAFMLINKASKKVLKHATGKSQVVQLMDYSPDIQDDDLFWTESQDFGEGFKTLRMASDTLLNVTAGHGNKVEDGSPVILDTWHKKDNQLWKVFPL